MIDESLSRLAEGRRNRIGSDSRPVFNITLLGAETSARMATRLELGECRCGKKDCPGPDKCVCGTGCGCK